MQPTHADYARILTSISDGAAINSFRQDYVYELFRRGLLAVDVDDRLRISDAGRDVCDRLARGEPTPEVDARRK